MNFGISTFILFINEVSIKSFVFNYVCAKVQVKKKRFLLIF